METELRTRVVPDHFGGKGSWLIWARSWDSDGTKGLDAVFNYQLGDFEALGNLLLLNLKNENAGSVKIEVVRPGTTEWDHFVKEMKRRGT
jgi:hypothetical protein